MTWAATTEASSYEAGEARLTSGDERASLEVAAFGEGLLYVTFAAPGPAARGRLALVLEEAVEQALSARGASPPGVGASSDLDASLSDQLYRARLAGWSGLAIALPSLEGIANLAGALDAEDSAVLRWWVAAARERAVRLYVDSRDRFLGVYGEPIRLHALLAATCVESPGSGVQAAPDVAASVAAMELSEPMPPVECDDEDDDDVEQVEALLPTDLELFSQPLTPEPLGEAELAAEAPPDVDEPSGHVAEPDLARAMAAIFEASDAVDVPASTGLDESVDGALERYAGWATSIAPEAAPEPVVDEVEALQHDNTSDGDDAGDEIAADSDDAVDEIAASADEAPPARTSARKGAPLHPRASEDWTRWTRDLEAARGPKPLAVIERMFVSAYVPLADAVARGLAGPKAVEVLAAWGSSFEHSYSEAFDALRLRGKRPTMVLDAPDVALRIGRLHGARSVQLLVIDGMRFDLGLRVQDRMRVLLGQRAALTERLLLWSALPTTTAVQLELIGRGPEGLKEPIHGAESELPVTRGRSAASLRRLKAGHRELMKLDLVESRLSDAGGPLAERLDDIADEVAEVLSNHFQRLPPRTLVMVFGDHGFVLDPLDGGTTAAHQGGASPEEVLVPAFAWLVGAVH